MVMVCGLLGYSVSLFHLTDHAFFKALLFLSAGSVIHAISDEQDLRKMDSDLVSASDEFKKRKFYLKYYWNCCLYLCFVLLIHDESLGISKARRSS